MNRFVSALICLALAAASAPTLSQGVSPDKKAKPRPPSKAEIAANEKAQHQRMALCSDKARDLKPGTPEHRRAITNCIK